MTGYDRQWLNEHMQIFDIHYSVTIATCLVSILHITMLHDKLKIHYWRMINGIAWLSSTSGYTCMYISLAHQNMMTCSDSFEYIDILNLKWPPPVIFKRNIFVLKCIFFRWEQCIGRINNLISTFLLGFMISSLWWINPRNLLLTIFCSSSKDHFPIAWSWTAWWYYVIFLSKL